MEKRLGGIIILVEDRCASVVLNELLSSHSSLILARQGIPLPDKGVSLISLLIKGDTDQIGALTGKLGRISGIQVKSVLTKQKKGNTNEYVNNG